MRLALFLGDSLTEVVPLADRPGRPSLSVLDPSRPGGFRARAYRQAHALHWAAASDVLWLGDSGTGELLRYGASGARLDSLSAPFPPRSWNANTVRRLARAASDPLDAAEWDAQWLPSAPPRFADLHADPGGGVWVEEFREDPTEPRELRLVEPRGAVTARMTVPGEVRVLEIGRDYLLGVQEDADGVPEVLLYQLNRR
jgi:streptogramin lyase